MGLDHLSFRVDDVDTLNPWLDHLDALGVTHHGVQRHAGTGSALIAFRDPDGLQIELYVQAMPPAGLAG